MNLQERLAAYRRQQTDMQLRETSESATQHDEALRAAKLAETANANRKEFATTFAANLLTFLDVPDILAILYPYLDLKRKPKSQPFHKEFSVHKSHSYQTSGSLYGDEGWITDHYTVQSRLDGVLIKWANSRSLLRLRDNNLFLGVVSGIPQWDTIPHGTYYHPFVAASYFIGPTNNFEGDSPDSRYVQLPFSNDANTLSKDVKTSLKTDLSDKLFNLLESQKLLK